MKRAALLLAAGLLVGCRAEMMDRNGGAPRLFRMGLDKPGRGGVLRYSAEGPQAFLRARRKDAERQMAEFCKDGYTVKAEGPWSTLGGFIPIGHSASGEFDRFLYVAFDCRNP